MQSRITTAAVAAICLLSTPATALNWEKTWNDQPLVIEWLNTASVGAAWRVEERDPSLVGKASLEQNRNLCAADDCIGLSESATEPNARFLQAPGALASYVDDGNLNYDKGDIISAAAKMSSRLNVQWNRWGLELSGIYFYDHVNEGFIEYHPNQIVSLGPQPGVFTTSRRANAAEKDVGQNFELRNANVYTRIPLANERELDIRVGRQLLNWGVSAFGINGSLNFINPPDLNNLARPGSELFELYRPAGMAVIGMDFGKGFSAEAFYQYEWVPVGLPPKGAYLSFFDAGGEPVPGEHIPLPFGKTPEDPGQLQRGASPLLSAVSATSFAGLRSANHEPRDGGQYGLALHYFMPNLGASGSEINFYFANYHARIPAASATATAASCTRREGNANQHDTTNVAEFLLDCGVPFVDTPGENGFEALPLDSVSYFLDYPEDIRIYGVSFSTEYLGAAIEAEVAYRPNQPIQVDLEDVLFAAFQPAFPRNTVDIVPGVATLAGSRRAVPDYLTAYRGGTPGEITPGSYIQGYERFKTIQTSVSLLKLWGADRYFKADQFGILFEAESAYIPDLPALDVLQLEGPGTFTHRSPGVSDSGDGLRINPIRNDEGYVTDFSWGYRAGFLFLYNDVFMPGLSLRPLAVFVHDVQGVGPGLAEQFLEGRQIILLNLEAKTGPWSVNLQQAIFTGAGQHNTLRDRDLFGIAMSYDF